ncbi:biliverdin-producing heme oxygenase [Flavobacterium limi]|uniref:Heme oxygenase n=1 Tax=Flavobacterium limi TaxID=2045105 RepID=A0ABQ1TWN6_9FLAO|nr:biliverdin-producing heme oxygenase [Flavobacterium limi]GGF05650.1 heme oxygenase [Flavobacterium limi]
MSGNLTSSIPSVFLSDLKNKTSDSHRKLESLPISASILSPGMTISDYIQYLTLMYDVHKNTENVVFPLLSEIITDLDQRKKSHLIKEDFDFLQYNKTDSNPIFGAQDITVPFALGILYVIEGSSLGGRYILKNISTIPGLDKNQGISYFQGYGDKTGSYWKNFLGYLSGYEEKHNCGNTIIEGAIYAFESIYNHFRSIEK